MVWTLRVAAGLMLAVLGGLIWFAARLPPPGDPAVAPVDGIVALTGGAARLDEAVALLAAGKGRRLLISGVDAGTDGETLRQRLGIAPPLFACCVDIGWVARDTVGNARETAAWAARHRFRRILLVTADYHMGRSLVELGRAMPDVDLKPHAVAPDRVPGDPWWDRPLARHLILREFVKYVGALVRARLLAPA